LPEGSKGKTDIYIFDLYGKQVAQLKKTGSNQFSANISALTPGEYIISVKDNSSGEHTTSKFIKTNAH
jgi:Tol biopolymer transport system component